MTEPTPSMQSPESERLLLAACMNPDRSGLLDSLLGLVAESDFSVEFHGILWNCIRVLKETGGSHDPTSVLEYTRRKNLFAGGVEYMGSLVEDPLALAASDEAVLAAASRVKGYSSLRQLQTLLANASTMCPQSGADGLENILCYVDDGIQSLRKTMHTSRTGPQPMAEIVDEVMELMEKQLDGLIVPAIPTGYVDLDQIVNGFADEDLIILGARPSMGKTSLAVNIAENISDGGVDVLVFSLEMKKTALGQRALSRRSRVNLTHIIRCEISEHDWPRIVDGIETLKRSRVWIDDAPGLTIHDIRARSRAFVARRRQEGYTGKILIMLDYLQYVSSAGQQEVRDHVATVSRGLKNLGRELKVPVLALSQLSRTLESRTNKRPIMSDLRESGAIEQDADVIMFLYRDEVYNPDTKEPGVAEVITAKHRNGPTGVARLGFSPGINNFFNLGEV